MAVAVGVLVGVRVAVGVRVGVAVGVRAMTAEFSCLGVPLIARPFASWPLRFTPSLLAQFASLSDCEAWMRSIE